MNYVYNYGFDFVNYNFDVRSWKITNKPNKKFGENKPWNVKKLLSHILYKNTFANIKAIPEEELKYKNIVWDGKGNPVKDRKLFLNKIYNHLLKQNEIAVGSNNYIVKTLIETINLNPQADENQELLKDWMKERFEHYKKIYGNKLLGVAIHKNEKSAHLSFIFENTKIKDKVLVYGLKEPEIILCPELQKEKEEYIMKYNKTHPDKPFKQRHNGVYENKQVWKDGYEYMKNFAKRHSGLNYKQEPIIASGDMLSKALKDIYMYKKVMQKLNKIAEEQTDDKYKDIINQLTDALAEANERNNSISKKNKHIINNSKSIKR